MATFRIHEDLENPTKLSNQLKDGKNILKVIPKNKEKRSTLAAFKNIPLEDNKVHAHRTVLFLIFFCCIFMNITFFPLYQLPFFFCL